MRVFFTDINKKSIYLLIFIIIAYTLWYLAERDMKEKSKSINQNYKSTIGSVVDFKKNKTISNYYFEFYYNGNLITGRSDIYGFEGVRCIGKYYKVEFSSENTNYSNILLDKEIIDSLEIINSGFKLN